MTLLALKSSSETEIQTRNPSLPEKKIGNQGLRKRILKRGTSWLTPFPGDEVQVHFSGHIDGGAYLDSSRESGTPFRFKLGQGEVIKGWDEGIATMKKGEIAIFTVPPILAYAEAGSPPLVPPNATLVFEIEMISWSSIRDITGDGGVLKKIIKEGEGWATPRDGDEVLVNYEARQENGQLICKTVAGVRFYIGGDDLCPAISKAVRTMRRGEKAELSVKFSCKSGVPYSQMTYGFNLIGNAAFNIENSVPTDSNSIIQLELVSWRSVIDVTGDKKVLKKIIKPGEGFDRPNEGSQVKVTYIAKLEDGTVYERKGSSEEPFEFTIMEEHVHDGLERAIMTMKKGEQALVSVSADFSCCHHASVSMSAENSVHHYEVELVDFVKDKPFWKMTTDEKLEVCERKKQEGNALFKAGKFWHASKKYEKAEKLADFDHSFTDVEKRIANGLRLSCQLNNAACKLKLEDYLEASKLCAKVLEEDPVNVKALFRRSQAYLKINELDKAEVDIKRALAIDPNNREVKLEYNELKMKQREYSKHEAELFGTIISKMG